MTDTTVMPLPEELVAQAIEAYRKLLAGDGKLNVDQFIAESNGDPGNTAGEIVDYASDQLGYVIDYDWDIPQTLRDSLYRVGYDWARTLTADTLFVPFAAAAVVL